MSKKRTDKVNEQITIYPNKGFGKIRFGMTVKQVYCKLGDPQIERKDDDHDIELVYSDLGISLGFAEEDNSTLGTMSFESDSTTLFGCKPIHMDIVEFLTEFSAASDFLLVKEGSWPEIEAEDYWCEVLGLLVYVVSGLVERISIFTPEDK